MTSARRILLISLVVLCLVALTVNTNKVLASEAQHIVISEIGIEGTGDFIELYNPTDVDIALGDYKLVKRTSTGSSDSSVVSLYASDLIPAHGFFLWCRNDISDTLNCDRHTGGSLSNDNSIGLKIKIDGTEQLVDAVTIGDVAYPLGEGTAISMDTLPEGTASIERKACTNSTTESMGSEDVSRGNAWDTDNNSNDFVSRNVSEPQNTTSQSEISSCQTTTPTPTSQPSPTPTISPTPTSQPSPTPTISPSPTTQPTSTPTSMPTLTPTPVSTVTPAPTATPTITPIPTPTPFTGKVKTQFDTIGITCAIQQHEFNIGQFKFSSPWLVCIRENGSHLFSAW